MFSMSDDKDFFIKAVGYFEKHDNVVTLTTQIYDTAWKTNRLEDGANQIYDGLYPCKMFCGGSHFLRKDFFENPPLKSTVFPKDFFENIDKPPVNGL